MLDTSYRAALLQTNKTFDDLASHALFHLARFRWEKTETSEDEGGENKFFALTDIIISERALHLLSNTKA